jgi:signal transduction histidine kinase
LAAEAGMTVGDLGLFTTAASPLTYLAIFATVAVLIWALLVLRRLLRSASGSGRRLEELEAALNEAEAALAAEPNILVIWRGRDGPPERVINNMKGAARVPDSPEAIAEFSGWLEPESAATVESAIAEMRESGTPFNLGIMTAENQLLEADGRAAGGLATLRIRPLAGERADITNLAYDARRLGKQVERLSALIDSAPLPIWLRNEAGDIIWANRAYIRAVEAPGIDAVIQGKLELVDRRRIEGDANPPANGYIGRTHAVIGGAKHALDIHQYTLTAGTAGYALDVSALEETEKELQRHIEAHASTLDKLSTAIAIFGPDQRLTFYNSAYVELWGLDADWLASRPRDGEILDWLRERRSLPEQANYRDWKSRQLQAYTTIEVRENWWYLPDGRVLHVICEQHPFGGVTYLYENVTKAIQLESRYNELIGVQRETLDNLHEGVALFGSDGRLKLHNPAFARFWSLDPAFLETEPHADQVAAASLRYHDDELHWDEFKYAVTALDTSRRPLKGRLSRKDGLVLEFASVPLPDGNTLITYVDVTDSSRIERALRERTEALEAADRLKTGFMSKVSYELRTPLTNILGFAESLSLGMAGELQSKQHEYLRHIQTSSEDLLSVIDAILDLTTIDAGAMELKLERIDVVDLMQGITAALEARIAKNDLTVSIEVPDDATEFIGDRKRVRQILYNLLSNAIGFSMPSSSIRMGTKSDGNDILLWVADTGRGIEPEFQQKAFDRFQSKPVTGGHRGAGLGLAIVKSFVELHEGKVSLHSQLGKGTTVVCRFPFQGPGMRKAS